MSMAVSSCVSLNVVTEDRPQTKLGCVSTEISAGATTRRQSLLVYQTVYCQRHVVFDKGSNRQTTMRISYTYQGGDPNEYR